MTLALLNANAVKYNEAMIKQIITNKIGYRTKHKVYDISKFCE
jgi:hypothetical protein